jgi:hypothetical protein
VHCWKKSSVSNANPQGQAYKKWWNEPSWKVSGHLLQIFPLRFSTLLCSTLFLLTLTLPFLASAY